MAPILARHPPQDSRQTVTTTTQAPTSQVLEFNCIYTHDILRKNQKRWHDGRLSFHAFNKRVMVYDLSRNSIGDTYAREFDTLNDGDEIRLDRPVLVQVCEAIGSKTQDLTGVIGTRDNASTIEAPRGSTYKPAIMPENAAAPSLKQVLGASKRVGRAHLLKSAYEQRQETLAQQSAALVEREQPAETPRPAKRQRKNDSQVTPSKQTPGRSPVPLAGGRPPLRVIKQAREIERAAAIRDYSSTKHTYTGPEQNPAKNDAPSILISSSPHEVIESLTPVETVNSPEKVRPSTTKAKQKQALSETLATESQQRRAKLKIGANTSKKRMMFGDLLAEASSKRSRGREEPEPSRRPDVGLETEMPIERVSNQCDEPVSIGAHNSLLSIVDELHDVVPAGTKELQPVSHSPSPENKRIAPEVSENHGPEEDTIPVEQEPFDSPEDILVDNQGWEGFSQVPSQSEPEAGTELDTLNPIDGASENIQTDPDIPPVDCDSAEKSSSPTPLPQSPAKVDVVQQDTNILVPSTPPSQPLQQPSITEHATPEVVAPIEETRNDEPISFQLQNPETPPPPPFKEHNIDEPALPVQPAQEPNPPAPQHSEALLPSKGPAKKPYRKKPLLNRDPPAPPPPPAKIPSSSPAFETQLSPRTRRQQREQANPSTTSIPTVEAPKAGPVRASITRKSKVVSLLKNSKPTAPTKRKVKDKDEVVYGFRPAASGLGAWSANETWDLFGWVPGTARCVSETDKLRS